MRILIRWIGLSLPFIEIGEAVVIGIFIEDIRILDRQAKLLEPLVRYGRMHHCGLQRRRKVAGAFPQHDQARQPCPAGRPLWAQAQSAAARPIYFRTVRRSTKWKWRR